MWSIPCKPRLWMWIYIYLTKAHGVLTLYQILVVGRIWPLNYTSLNINSEANKCQTDIPPPSSLLLFLYWPVYHTNIITPKHILIKINYILKYNIPNFFFNKIDCFDFWFWHYCILVTEIHYIGKEEQCQILVFTWNEKN